MANEQYVLSPWEQARSVSPIDFELAYITQPIPIATGTPLDRPLGGGIPVGTFTVIGGEPGTGKSAFAVMAAYYAALAGRHPIFVSLEMPSQMVISRMLSIHSNEMRRRLGGGHPELQVFWSKTGDELQRHIGGIGPRADMLKLDGRGQYEAAQRYISAHGEDDVVLRTWHDFKQNVWPNMAVIDSYNSIDQVCQCVTAVANSGIKPFPIIDYLQLGIAGDQSASQGNQNKSEYELVNDASRKLAQVCKQHRIPMMVLSSLRKVGKKEKDDGPSLSWFKGSNSVVYDAGTAIVLAREGQSVNDSSEDVMVKAHIIKNRVGRVGDATMRFWGNTNIFEPA